MPYILAFLYTAGKAVALLSLLALFHADAAARLTLVTAGLGLERAADTLVPHLPPELRDISHSILYGALAREISHHVAPAHCCPAWLLHGLALGCLGLAATQACLLVAVPSKITPRAGACVFGSVLVALAGRCGCEASSAWGLVCGVVAVSLAHVGLAVRQLGRGGASEAWGLAGFVFVVPPGYVVAAALAVVSAVLWLAVAQGWARRTPGGGEGGDVEGGAELERKLLAMERELKTQGKSGVLHGGRMFR